MLGAIIGDIAGNPYEWRQFDRTQEIKIPGSGHITDDSVLTIALCESLLTTQDPNDLFEAADKALKKFGNLYPHAGYGQMFWKYLQGQSGAAPSFGNGAAMRVSPCGWAGRSLSEVQQMALKVTLPSHSHEEAIKGAQATASVVFLGRSGKSKDVIREYVQQHFYNLKISYDDYRWNATCMDTVPYAVKCFLDTGSFKEAVTRAVRLGGDTDTMGAITGSMAEAFYGLRPALREEAISRLDDTLKEVVLSFEARFGTKIS